MKEETKSNLKKFGKVTAYGLGLFAMLLLGVGLGNCSSKGASSNGKAVAEASLHDQKALSPKRALDPADYHTLADVDDNLLFDAQAGHYYFISATSGDVQGYRLGTNLNNDMYLIHLDVGAYVLDVSSSVSDYLGDYVWLNDYGAIEVQKRLNGEPYDRAFVESTDVGSYAGITNADTMQRRVLNATSSFQWLCMYLNNTGTYGVSLSLYDPLKAPAVATFDFPVLFNPYPLGGSPASGDFIFNGPSISGVTSQVLYINNLSFRSNGKLYNRVMFTYTHDTNQTFGHYDASGNFVLDGTLGASAWYFRSMTYLYGTQYADVVWNAKFENVDSNLAWKPALVSGGLWVAQEYRHIEVLSFNGSTLGDLPSTSLVLNSSVESVLKLISSYVAPSTSEMGNPFTLIREGFSAVGGLLQIQILPFMTLGTLIFVPLVVLVILAILKLLAK